MPVDPPVPPSLARIQTRVRGIPALRRFTFVNRLLLAMAFIPTGLVKATGRRFTLLPVENPVGFFFEAMFLTGPWWILIGVMQVLAGVCLLVPATATLGAVLFLPIVLSVFLITVGVGFEGTVWVTGGMLLSSVYLVCWDGDRIWGAAAKLLEPDACRGAVLEGAPRVERVGWGMGLTAGMGLFLMTRGFMPRSALLPLLVLGGAGGVLVLAGWWTLLRRR